MTRVKAWLFKPNPPCNLHLFTSTTLVAAIVMASPVIAGLTGA